jgi:hypothetical protein
MTIDLKVYLEPVEQRNLGQHVRDERTARRRRDELELLGLARIDHRNVNRVVLEIERQYLLFPHEGHRDELQRFRVRMLEPLDRRHRHLVIGGEVHRELIESEVAELDEVRAHSTAVDGVGLQRLVQLRPD